jgi:hypothetical protein
MGIAQMGRDAFLQVVDAAVKSPNGMFGRPWFLIKAGPQMRDEVPKRCKVGKQQGVVIAKRTLNGLNYVAKVFQFMQEEMFQVKTI